jgi:hypothetical protein
MSDGTRLQRLHLVRARLERLPASAHRDWMLSEVRARAVDVETGAQPRSMRQFDAEAAIPPRETAEPQSAKVDRSPPPRTRAAARPARRPTDIRHVAAQAVSAPPGAAIPPTPDAVVAPSCAGRADSVDLLEHGGVLCLDEVSLGASLTVPYTSSPPWARGLRG